MSMVTQTKDGGFLRCFPGGVANREMREPYDDMARDCSVDRKKYWLERIAEVEVSSNCGFGFTLEYPLHHIRREREGYEYVDGGLDGSWWPTRYFGFVPDFETALKHGLIREVGHGKYKRDTLVQ